MVEEKMTFTDAEFMSFIRRKPLGNIQQQDVRDPDDMYALVPFIYFLSRYVGTCEKPIFVEIGTHDGSSLLPLLKSAGELNGFVYSIDPGDCSRAESLVHTMGYTNIWQWKKQKSDEFFTNFHEKISFSVVDGDHDFCQVAKDVANLYVRTVHGGFIFVTDWNNLFASANENDSYEERCSNGATIGTFIVLGKVSNFQTLELLCPGNSALVIRKGHSTIPNQEVRGDYKNLMKDVGEILKQRQQ